MSKFINPIGNEVDYQQFCIQLADGTVVYRHVPECNECGDPYYTDFQGNKISEPDLTGSEKCSDEVTQSFCVESQEWTYAIDNTGTQTNFNAEIEITLSDGSSFTIQQTNQGSISQWTPQMAEWGANIQQAADDAGLAWFVETRYIAGPGSLAGGGGFSGPPSEVVSNALWEGNIRARYVNIQICPGQPVPVKAVFKGIDNTDTRYDEVNLTTAGAVLGPIQKFWICKECGDAPVWYLQDGVTLATSGQIPNCWEPCGTLSQLDSPPDRECDFDYVLGCDNNNQTDPLLYTNQVTRRATICNGEQIAVDYYVEDPTDPNVLIPYDLVGEFVDCDTGEPTPLPCGEKEVLVDKELVCVDLGNGCNTPAFRIVRRENCIDSETFITQDGDVTSQVISWHAGHCGQGRTKIDTCWLPDQYAIQWSWGGNADLASYNALTDTTTYYGKTQVGTTNTGGYALAFKNDAVEPTLYFQVNGTLYKADPNDPINTFITVGPTSVSSDGSTPTASSSYPCFDYIDGQLLIGDGRQAWVIDETTGNSSYLGRLIDVRDGADLNVSPGDWFSDPNGDWFMMAMDNRGASFINPADGLPYCTGTVLWKIDKQTLEATRISSSCSPVSGTGASWLAANQYLLSTSSGVVYRYNKLTDVWDVYYNADDSGTNVTINDLAPQWIVPDPIPVFGWVDDNCPETNPECTPTLFTIEQLDSGDLECKRFVPTTPGKFQCTKDPNPFVSDPFDDSSGGSSQSGCERCPDEDWHDGCSDAGPTKWRRYYDSSGNQYIEYYYGTLPAPTTETPSGFTLLSCEDAPNPNSETTEWCNGDVVPNKTVFRKEYSDGTIVWYDDTGTITEPTNKTPGECQQTDPLLPVTDEIICFEGTTYTRVRYETYVPNVDGVPELDTFQIAWYNEDGTFYDSGVLPAGSSFTEPGEYYFGDCNTVYQEIRFEKLCEEDDEKLLLIDSGGGFAEYSFYDGSLTDINTISVPSAGGSADPDNFVLYNFVSPDQLYVTDVNTKQVVNQVTLFSNDGSPLTFSAASFDVTDGFLYSHDNANIYRTDVNIGEVSLVTPLTGVAGSGTSMAIDANGRMIVMGSLGRVYEIDRGTGAGSLIYTSAYNVGNGSTFNASNTNPLLYITSGNNTVEVDLVAGTETLIIDSWAPGANSIAFYRTQAQIPNCFYRKFGIPEDPNANPVYISDHFVSDFSDRVISGAVNCCECSNCSGGSSVGGGSTVITNFPEVQDLEKVEICDGNKTLWQVSTANENGIITVTYEDETGVVPEPASWTVGRCVNNCEVFDYYELTNVTGTLRNREWHDTAPTVPNTAGTEEGRNFRLNHDFSLPTTTDNSQSNLQLNDTDNTPVELDIQVKEGFVIVTEPMDLRYIDNSEGYWAVELGQCCGELELLAENGGFFAGRNMPFSLPVGIHKIRLWNIDSGGSNSSANLQYSTDGGISWVTDNTPPNIQISETKPSQECKQGYLCEGQYFELDKTAPVVFNDSVSLCKIECQSNDGGTATLEETEYTTGFATEVLNSAFVVPSFPPNTKEVVVFNDSGAIIVIDTNVGQQTVMQGGTIEFSVFDYETPLTATAITLVSGTFNPSDTIVFNYKTIS